VCCRGLGNHYRSTNQASVSKVVVSLRHRAERITIDETLDSIQGSHLDNLQQRDAAAVKTRHELRAGRLFEEIERNSAAARADHRQTSAPRQSSDRCGKSRVYSHAIQNERRSDPAAEFANLLRGFRATHDNVIGAILTSQVQSGFGRIDGDDSRGSQLAQELNCIETEPTDTDHHRIMKWLAARGMLVPLAGTGAKGTAGVGGPPDKLQLNQPHGVYLDPQGHLYICDSMNNRILKIEN